MKVDYNIALTSQCDLRTNSCIYVKSPVCRKRKRKGTVPDLPEGVAERTFHPHARRSNSKLNCKSYESPVHILFSVEGARALWAYFPNNYFYIIAIGRESILTPIGNQSHADAANFHAPWHRYRRLAPWRMHQFFNDTCNQRAFYSQR